MRVDLSGRTALVAGGARGVGGGIVKSLAGAGARVFIGDVVMDTALETANGLCAEGLAVSALKLDVTAADDWAAVRGEILEQVDKLDILIYSAGIFPESDIYETEPAMWQRIQDINCTGFYLGGREILPHMASNQRGVVVAIGSLMTYRPVPRMPAYCVSKAGLDILVRSLALQHAGDQIRILGVNPGWVDTEGERIKRAEQPDWVERAENRIPLGRLQVPDDFGPAVTFLCSDLASMITGVWLNIDGGLGIR